MSVFWCITLDLQINWTHFPSFSHFFHLGFPSRPPGSVWSVRLPPQRLPSPCCRASGERVGRYVFSCGGWVSWMSWVSLVAEICWCEQSISNWTKVKNLTNGEQLLWVGFGILLLSLGHSYQSCQRGESQMITRIRSINLPATSGPEFQCVAYEIWFPKLCRRKYAQAWIASWCQYATIMKSRRGIRVFSTNPSLWITCGRLSALGPCEPICQTCTFEYSEDLGVAGGFPEIFSRFKSSIF